MSIAKRVSEDRACFRSHRLTAGRSICEVRLAKDQHGGVRSNGRTPHVSKWFEFDTRYPLRSASKGAVSDPKRTTAASLIVTSVRCPRSR